MNPELLRLAGVAALTIGVVERVYGGPEEGGWWYDHFTPRRVFVVPRRRLQALARRLQRRADVANAGEPPLHSVLSRGRVEVRAGVEPETERPAYA